MNCMDSACKYCYEDYNNKTKVWECYCQLTGEIIPDDINPTQPIDIEQTQCENFVQAKTCLDCKHSKTTAYETGTIDDIQYRCPFQNNKLIYDDSNVYSTHYADIPECNIGRFELNE